MKIVFLDRKTIGEDIDLSGFERFGEVVIYDYSSSEEVPARVEDADVIVLNKVLINEQTVGKAKNLKLVCVTATGTNNLDKDFLAARGIEWRNVAGYSTEAVTQHTFALAFNLMEHLNYYDDYVKSEKYVNDKMFTHFEMHFHELNGKNWGIIGLGAIGKRVAEVAKCFGANVSYYSTSGKNHDNTYKEVDFDTLLAESDIVSIHAPLDDNTLHLMDAEAFKKMKKSAILINVGRGPIIVEKDLAEALESGQIAAAGLDVLDVEPMSPENPLVRVKDSNKLLITPHIAWAAVEARQRLMKIIEGQIEEWSK
ncbi:glycerate dehydrogenase [Pseudobutyrivibrio sp. YE44]|uniref:D-2-hydroxyacid dehydrogenase n=1 Tax=Pseudobutyrivibrio sp. YE44 TaxID=1520802 RepID=UPI0008841ECD|nr:D-2-hydroxyacid dehydrogenase [Pseudobutyrivibrio sp. YE44]SDB45429.1 glycerate dehydrogenase [Pseudobutyrivibrio sp. YE44]